jgi:hypothetical protein
VIDVLQVARVRILRYLARRGVVRLLPEALEINDELAERDPVLAQLAAAAVSGLPPAGPEQRCRSPIRLSTTDSAGPTPMGALVVQELGFNLHAASLAGAEDQAARERLVRYVLRPPTQLTISVPRTVPLAISRRLSTTRIERSSGHTVDDSGSVFVDLDTHDKRPNEQSPLIPIEVLEAGTHLLGEVG